MQDHFGHQLVGLLPKLRAQALALTRDQTAADDLVQDAVTKAWAARGSFEPGTNFGAWMRTILRNHFLEQRRKQRELLDLDGVPASVLAVADDHESRLVVQELERAMNRLPPMLREVLIMAAVLGMPHHAIAATTSTALGTVKTRILRAREQLWTMLLGESVPRPQAPRTDAPPRAAE